MKFLKLFSIVALSAVSMTMFAAINAQANIAVRGNISGYGDEIDLYQDDANSQLVTDIPATQPSSINMYAVINSTNYSSVKQANLEGLQIVFKANTKETDYTLKFNNVSGEEYFLQKGDDTDPENWIPMTTDFPFTCAVSEEITFTVVKEAAPEADYTRSVTSGNWGTICLPKASSSFSGMALYTVAGYVEAENVIALDPMATEQMVAGMPYFFQASADKIEVNYTGDDADAQEGANHLVGTLGDMTVSGLSYIVKDNLLWQADGAHVAANRAYIALANIAEMAPATSAPGRKFIAVPKGMPTDMQEVKAMEDTRKAIVNGRLVIIREGRMFNALGGMK